MQWSKLRKLVEAQFAPSLGGEVTIHSTRYGNCTCGRAWLSLKGEEIANFCTRAAWNVRLGRAKGREGSTGWGIISRQDAYQACWALVHDLTIEAALIDEDEMVRALAMLDRRIGKNRLRTLAQQEHTPLIHLVLNLRLKAEGLPTDSRSR